MYIAQGFINGGLQVQQIFASKQEATIFLDQWEKSVSNGSTFQPFAPCRLRVRKQITSMGMK